MHRAEKRVARLLIAVDHLDGEPGVGLQACEHAVAVGGAANRRCRDRDRPLRAGCRGNCAEVAHRRDGRGDRARLEPAASIDMTGELERCSGVRDDVELTGSIESEDCDPGRVRPDVDDGERGIYGDHLPGSNPGGSGKYRQHRFSGVQGRPVSATSGGAASASATIRSSR